MAKKERGSSGPNSTAEWILLVIVGLLLLVPVYHLCRWALGKMGEHSEQVEQTTDELIGP